MFGAVRTPEKLLPFSIKVLLAESETTILRVQSAFSDPNKIQIKKPIHLIDSLRLVSMRSDTCRGADHQMNH